MNIQDYKDAILLTEWATANPGKRKVGAIYYVHDKGMLYEVDPADGSIVGQKYILDISFDKVSVEPTDSKK